MSERYTATISPPAVGLLFAQTECLSCELKGETAIWRFKSGLMLKLELPDESKCRYVPNWHIGEWEADES